MKFGENLKRLRKEKKLSQEELAEKVGVSRQSVSKWETGDAYPEMNNILELCKIFHCHINELVNDSILDVESLDEDVMNCVVKFKKEQQQKMKGLSKAIFIIARVMNIIMTVCIPIVAITMIILGVFLSKIDITDNEIKLNDTSDKITIVQDEGILTIRVNDMVVSGIENQQVILKIKEILNNESKYLLLGYVETGLLFLIILLVMLKIMLKSLSKLFDNIYHGDTPFTLENVKYIKKMAYLMIAITFLPNVMGVIFEMILDIDLNIGFELFSLVEVLFLFSIAYIFQYGYEIQLDSKGKMYGDVNE